MDLVRECLGLAEKKLATLNSEFDRELHELTSQMDTMNRDRLLSVLNNDRNKVRLRLQSVKNRKLAVLRETSLGCRGDLPGYSSPTAEPHSVVPTQPGSAGPSVVQIGDSLPLSQSSPAFQSAPLQSNDNVLVPPDNDARVHVSLPHIGCRPDVQFPLHVNGTTGSHDPNQGAIPVETASARS